MLQSGNASKSCQNEQGNKIQLPNSNTTTSHETFIVYSKNFTSHRIQKRLVRLTRATQVRSEACDMLIAIDEPLYVTYDRDLKNLTRMVQTYVRQLNEIYHRYVLRTHEMESIPYQ